MRTVIEEIVVTLDEATQTLAFVVHWKGGVHTQCEMQKPRGAAGQGTALEDLDIIRPMATRYGDDAIAYVLNKLGRRTGKGKRWNQERVATARRNHAIPGQPPTPPDPDILTMGRAAEYLGVSARRRFGSWSRPACCRSSRWFPPRRGRSGASISTPMRH